MVSEGLNALLISFTTVKRPTTCPHLFYLTTRHVTHVCLAYPKDNQFVPPALVEPVLTMPLSCAAPVIELSEYLPSC